MFREKDIITAGLHRSRFHDNDDGAILFYERVKRQHGITWTLSVRPIATFPSIPVQSASATSVNIYLDSHYVVISDELESCQLSKFLEPRKITQLS